MFKQAFTSQFNSQARTLEPEEVFGPTWGKQTGQHSYTHPDGWTICGEIHEDYFYWVNDFEATHPVLGWVKGNFETEVCASSREAYDDFVRKHEAIEWDYYDI
jgi:hypothetical protein